MDSELVRRLGTKSKRAFNGFYGFPRCFWLRRVGALSSERSPKPLTLSPLLPPGCMVGRRGTDSQASGHHLEDCLSTTKDNGHVGRLFLLSLLVSAPQRLSYRALTPNAGLPKESHHNIHRHVLHRKSCLSTQRQALKQTSGVELLWHRSRLPLLVACRHCQKSCISRRKANIDRLVESLIHLTAIQ